MSSLSRSFRMMIVVVLIAGCTTFETELPDTLQPPSPTKEMTSTSTANSATAAITPSFTPAPTLTDKQREANILELLTNNGGCELPCFWGIKPGKTSWDETRKFLEYLGVRYGSESMGNGSIYHGTGGFDLEEELIFIRIGFVETDGSIESINVQSYGHSNLIDFREDWKQYLLGNVLKEFGPPSEVWLYAEVPHEPSDTSSYTLILYYDDQGIKISYTGSLMNKPIYKMCPTSTIFDIRLLLQSSESPSPWKRPKPSDDGTQTHFTLEEAARMDLLTFYEIFASADSEACLETSRDIWE